MGFPVSQVGPRRATVRVATLAVAVVLGSFGAACKKNEGGQMAPAPGAAPAAPSGGNYKFAFVTNNSTDFWNIGEKGLRKAEKDFGVKVDMFRPLKGEVADQQRFLEDIMVQGYDGVAISPMNPDALTGIFD